MTFLDTGHHSRIELTPEEMLTISQEISLKFSPIVASIIDNDSLFPEIPTYYNYLQTNEDDANTDLYSVQNINSSFSPKELNEISEEISRCFAPKVSIAEPELFLLPVDPHHLYAYWDIGENKARLAFENNAVNNLTLRIYWRPDTNPDIKSSNVWFDVTADNPESRQKVRLPIDDSAYSATLGKLNPDNSLDVLATSNIIHVPPTAGRIRMPPLRRNPNHPLPDSDSEIAPASRKQAPHATKGLFEDALIDSEMKGILYEKQKEGAQFPEQGWFVKLHFSHPPADRGDVAKIDSELMAIFNEKGIGVELIPEPGFIEPSNVQGKNASGQGM